MRLMLTPRSPKALAMRSCVRGRPSELPEILVAIACASEEPIQIGRYRSASFSLRITRCCAVGMWILMESTETSMRFFILEPILALGPGNSSSLQPGAWVWHQPSPTTGAPATRSPGGAGTAGSDRCPQPDLPRFFCAAADEHLQRRGDQRGLWVHLDARHRAGVSS